jgi:hypothetical protein
MPRVECLWRAYGIMWNASGELMRRGDRKKVNTICNFFPGFDPWCSGAHEPGSLCHRTFRKFVCLYGASMLVPTISLSSHRRSSENSLGQGSVSVLQLAMAYVFELLRGKASIGRVFGTLLTTRRERIVCQKVD